MRSRGELVIVLIVVSRFGGVVGHLDMYWWWKWGYIESDEERETRPSRDGSLSLPPGCA
jgi:hypothetical protein